MSASLAAPPADVYFVQRGDAGPVKIGSARDVTKRVVALQTATPERLHVIARVPGAGFSGEMELHRRFAHRRIRGEWFSPSPDLVAFAARCRVAFRRQWIDVPYIDDFGYRHTSCRRGDQVKWIELESEVIRLLAAVVRYRDDIAVATRLLKLHDLAPDTATPAEAAESLGTTVDAWLMQEAAS